MSAVESHVAFILDDLAKRAVAEIMKLFDNTFAAFIEELNKKQNDIDRLTKTLHSNQVVDTTGKTSDETFPTSRHGESHGNHQSAEDSQHWAMGNMGQHCLSTQVTQWDFPDEQQYIFEGRLYILMQSHITCYHIKMKCLISYKCIKALTRALGCLPDQCTLQTLCDMWHHLG